MKFQVCWCPALTLIGALLVASVAVGDDTSLRQLLDAVTKHPSAVNAWPTPPALSSVMKGEVAAEMTSSPSVRAALEKLNPDLGNHDWSAAIDSLEQQKAVWALQASLCHPYKDVRIDALRALGRLKDARAVPFLLIYADYMDVMVSGSENATLHFMMQGSIVEALSSISGVRPADDRQDQSYLRQAIRQYTRWQLDNTK